MAGKVDRLVKLSKAFRPSTAVDTQDLFAGRVRQLERLADVVLQPGQHAIVYGIRGVGKTSLARVMTDVLERVDTVHGHLYTCNTGDTFDSIWRSVLEDVGVSFVARTPGFGERTSEEGASLLDVMARALVAPDGSTRAMGPDDVRRALDIVSGAMPRVFVVDEFDRMTDSLVRQKFADLIKTLSDHGVASTVVLVGVADSVDQLVEEHPSISRCMAQIHMQPMSRDELAEIIDRGMAMAELQVEEKFRDEVVRLAHGLPHYVHLISQYAGRIVIEEGRDTVLAADLVAAINRSTEDVDELIRDAYHRATWTNRDTLHRDVLLACALAERDDRDTFGATDVREKLAIVTGKFREIPAFSAHLKEFSGNGDRGGVLDRLGSQRRFRYRFCDPLLPPYVLMKGHVDQSRGEVHLPLWMSISPSAGGTATSRGGVAAT